MTLIYICTLFTQLKQVPIDDFTSNMYMIYPIKAS